MVNGEVKFGTIKNIDVMGFTKEDFGETIGKAERLKPEKLDTTKYLNRLEFFFFKFFCSMGLKFLPDDMIDFRVVRWKIEHQIGLTEMEMFLAKVDLAKLKERKVYFVDYVSKWGTSLLDNDYLVKNELSVSLYASKMNREIKRAKRYWRIASCFFCVGVLMIGVAIGEIASSSGSSRSDAFQTESYKEGSVYVSDSPGSKRYHKDRNCQALKRSTGHITATDEANAIGQGKTLCGWCGK